VSSPRLISMWSGPRNVSTAMMYSWRERSDTEVVDEPWYAYYLLDTGVDHPGAAEAIASQPTEIDAVIAVLTEPGDRPIRFLKNMAHHVYGPGLSVLDLSDNYLLVRDPRDMLPSLRSGLGYLPTIDQTGLEQQVAIYDHLTGRGSAPPVIETRSLLENPRRVLTALCRALDLDFDEACLSWPTGPKPEDGIWAPHWYAGVHASTGFGRYSAKSTPLDPDLADLYERCRSLYERLVEDAL